MWVSFFLCGQAAEQREQWTDDLGEGGGVLSGKEAATALREDTRSHASIRIALHRNRRFPYMTVTA